MAVGVTTGLAVSAFNLAESHVHASVFAFTFQTFLVPSSSETIAQTTIKTDVVLNKFQTLSQNSGNASFVSHSLQVIVPTLGGCVVSALRDLAGGSFLGEEAVGTATSRAASASAAVSRDEENKNATTKTSSVVVEDVKKTVLKTVAAVVTLGTGASLGPEGPSVEIGAAVSSGVGRVASYFELKAFGVDERKSINNNNNINGNSNISSSVGNVGLLAAGAAAGLLAGFGAPIAGLFFGFESVLARNSTYTFGQQQFNNASTTEMVIVAPATPATGGASTAAAPPAPPRRFCMPSSRLALRMLMLVASRLRRLLSASMPFL